MFGVLSYLVRYELRPNGEELDVTADDLQEWVDQVVWVLLVDSVVKQVGAIVKGASTSKYCSSLVLRMIRTHVRT